MEPLCVCVDGVEAKKVLLHYIPLLLRVVAYKLVSTYLDIVMKKTV